MFHINIDLSSLLSMDTLDERLKKEVDTAAAQLVSSIHAHILEEANKKLKSRRQAFVDALSVSQEGENTWLIVLDKNARWIDDGMDPHEMVDDLLNQKAGSKGKVKRSKDGSLYRSIPFGHGPGKGPTNSTPAQQDLTNTIKAHLKKAHNDLTGERGIPYGKIEKDASGKPLLGKIHDVNIRTHPLKTHQGPGQGHGPVGQVRQGPTGIPFLQGIRIYQRMHEGRVQRAIMTFRTVSTKHKGTGRWHHPGLQPVNIMDEAYEWGVKEWESNILPKILEMIARS